MTLTTEMNFWTWEPGRTKERRKLHSGRAFRVPTPRGLVDATIKSNALLHCRGSIRTIKRVGRTTPHIRKHIGQRAYCDLEGAWHCNRLQSGWGIGQLAGHKVHCLPADTKQRHQMPRWSQVSKKTHHCTDRTKTCTHRHVCRITSQRLALLQSQVGESTRSLASFCTVGDERSPLWRPSKGTSKCPNQLKQHCEELKSRNS